MSENEAQPTWQAESTNPELIEGFKQKMAEVIDPELGLNIIQLGLIRDLIIDADSAEVKMILTTPFCPYGPAMLETTRQKAETYLERPTTIELELEMWTPDMMDEEARTEWGFF
jgi:metal-sulfur cluster biosynthetic enzyme